MNDQNIDNVNTINSTIGYDLTLTGASINLTASSGLNVDSMDIINLTAPSGVYINTMGGGGGDGQIYANTFNGNLNGTASNAITADTANYATSSGSSSNTQSIQVNQNTANATNYITFSDGYTTMLRSLRSNAGLTYNPSTNVLSATTFSGNATTATLATTITTTNTTANLSHYLNFSDSSSTGNGSVQKTAGISCNPSTNTITATTFNGNATTATNSTNTVNCSTTSTTTSGTYYPVFVSSNITGNYPNLVGVMTYNPSTNTITANTFSGALSGTATNSTNVAITSDNTSGTYYIPFTKTSGTGNKPLFQDDTTGPLTYNPSTGAMSATSYTINGTPSAATTASKFGQVGLVYIGAVQVAITGSAVAQNLNFASLFNSTYKNYRITLTPTTQLAFTAYPNYALAGFLGTSVPTTGGLFGYEITSTAPALVSPIYSAQTTVLATTPLVFAVSSFANKQVQFDILNVGYATTATQSVQLNCKSIYNNPAITGASDRTISVSALTGTTITGLIIQQTALSVGNDMTLEATIYGYNPI